MGAGVGGRILLLGEDPQSATKVAEHLRAEGDLSVVSETSLDDAIERLEVDAFHCLVCDDRVPGADGPAIVRRVRTAHPDVPIVLITGSDAIAGEAISAGATDYVRRGGGGEAYDLIANRVETAVEKYRAERKLLEERRQNDEFVRLVAHDLRNPMAVARGWIEVLYDDGGEVPYRKAVDALHRMDEIVDNLETLARSDEARSVDERIELSAVATAAWELVESDGADLHVEYGPEIRADVSMLQQILENLFTNAVEHGSTSNRPGADDDAEPGSTSPDSQAREDAVGREASDEPSVADAPEDAEEHSSTSPRRAEDAVEHGGEDVTVRVGTTEDGFYVADDGGGIDPAVRERIFESGYTGDGGSGLGLAIVERIADAHGWDVSVGESEDGGARFDFTGAELDFPREAFR